MNSVHDFHVETPHFACTISDALTNREFDLKVKQ